jgi:hypothetical protein
MANPLIARRRGKAVNWVPAFRRKLMLQNALHAVNAAILAAHLHD